MDSARPDPRNQPGPEAPASAGSSEPVRLLVAAGGTGGHIFPALAVAEELVRRGRSSAAALQFLGTARGLETRLIEGAGFPYRALAAAGLKGIAGWRMVKNAAVLPRTFLEALGVLRLFRPEVVLGMGGYVAGPVMLEAAFLRIPTLLVEPNASPGFTNRSLAPFVTLAAIGFEETARSFGAKARLTGLPVRRAFFNMPPRQHRPPFTVLVFGGSQGSAALNRCFVDCLPLLASRPLRFIHQTGERDASVVREAYRKANVPAEVSAFIDDMPGMFARADLVIARAGASTVGEITAAAKAAVLVPFPGATDQHQLGNARALERAGAARMIEQATLTAQRLLGEIDDLIGSPGRLFEMESAARTLARSDAAARIADLVEALAARRRRGHTREDRSSAR
ncbi:MAG TPA: undecaprenyldiphospho-muramoylpentapeptide beta-N-acetylglucosaminyltransferase [Terriglobia bacterium]|nr:undecaprenyldiphospho-muramoylpentapeptide beta-N-acetylglucosaminyltransferase [Terriglobia bacterium]